MIILLISSSPLSVLAQPPPPCVFYGNVTVGRSPAQDGLNVTAVTVGTTLKWTTLTKNGTYGWPVKGSSLFLIPSDNPDTTEKDGGITGDTIEFYVNGTKADRTATFESSGAKQVDLSIPATVLEQSTLAVALDCSTTYSGYMIKISGKLAYADGVGISAASLLATFSVTGGQSWHEIAAFNTTVNGDYYAEWTPSAAGNYLIKVSWGGRENVVGAETYANLAVTSLEQKYVFSVISNSTVSNVVFNSTSRVLSFTLDGLSGTKGYTNVTIAKDLIADTAGMKVYLDDSQIDYTIISNDASWLLHFTYQHSTHTVIVNLGLSTPPFIQTPLGIATLSGIIAVSIAIIYMGSRRLRQPRNTKPAKSGLKPRK
jgi:hypothetical protein